MDAQTAQSSAIDVSARAQDARPLYAVIAGHLTPYRVHFQRRIAREVPEVRLATLVTKYRTNQWINSPDAESNTVMLDSEPPPEGGRKGLAFVRHELAIARRVWAWLDEHRPAAVFCSGYDELPNIWAMRWARKRGVPALMGADSNVHGDLTRGVKRIIKNMYLHSILPRYSAILVCGDVGRRYFHRYGVSDERMFDMPYEPDYRLIQGMSSQRVDEIASTLGLERGRRRFVCCCRLIDVKRVDVVIDGFAAIAADRPEWDLIIVGEGERRSELEARVTATLRESRRVRFVGFQDQEHVTGVYRCSDVLVLASDYEPWGLVINESVAAGMALVTTDRVGASYALLKHGSNGFMVPARDGEAFAKAMRDISDPAKIEGYKAASGAALAHWRAVGDPIRGLRAALAKCGVIDAT